MSAYPNDASKARDVCILGNSRLITFALEAVQMVFFRGRYGYVQMTRKVHLRSGSHVHTIRFTGHKALLW